ncbi:MAG: hypothetical protein LBV74_15385 [Tannerella sp.]|nr:hypothetical protein [Tannerella sp.]
MRNCPENEKEFHARIFRIGNAAYIYHQLATSTTNNETLKVYYQEWLEGLPANIKADMETKEFDQCKNMFPFTRYVNERNDIGMNEWMKEHLSEEYYKDYKSGK